MGLDILIYNNDGICMNKSEISEDLHYWLFNLANLDKGRFRTIFRVQDYYKTNIQLSGIEISSFIEELKEIRKKSPYSKEIERIVNCGKSTRICPLPFTLK